MFVLRLSVSVQMAKIYLGGGGFEDKSKINMWGNKDDIANQFNNFFCSVAPTIQSNIKPNFKTFDHFLTEP